MLIFFVFPLRLLFLFPLSRRRCLVESDPRGYFFIIQVSSSCAKGQFTCSNLECRPANKFCDGVPDCNDASDEDPLHCIHFLWILLKRVYEAAEGGSRQGSISASGQMAKV
ncbi:unnamed protein product [Protopolystoma xenopodis]|uniref:Low-density lipoprotein receptor domain class A n=1 Tax=Protopolystoma xenopodis TaxID=117903 RepID=A0A448WB07_9PLAT|nr:unnamed protein product [Protopolystoma xenopodis]